MLLQRSYALSSDAAAQGLPYLGGGADRCVFIFRAVSHHRGNWFAGSQCNDRQRPQLTHIMSPQLKSGHGRNKRKRPDYAAMAETIEQVGGDLVARAKAEGEESLAVQGNRLLKLAAEIRAGLED
jgi:Spy/CpxP family protein refolding chaperone